jgi:hypothetical protein
MVSLLPLGVTSTEAGLFSFGAGLGLALIIGAIILWILPIAIAGMRGHPNFWPIVIIDVLLGWIFIGWVVALVWSMTAIQRTGQAAPYRPASASATRSQAVTKATAMARSGKRIVIKR